MESFNPLSLYQPKLGSCLYYACNVYWFLRPYYIVSKKLTNSTKQKSQPTLHTKKGDENNTFSRSISAFCPSCANCMSKNNMHKGSKELTSLLLQTILLHFKQDVLTISISQCNIPFLNNVIQTNSRAWKSWATKAWGFKFNNGR